MKYIYPKLILITFVTFFNYALAFEIGPLAQSEIDSDFSDVNLVAYNFEKNHEKITALALLCLAESNRGQIDLINEPVTCGKRNTSDERLNSLFTNLKSDKEIPKQILNYIDLIAFVRWPDDPIRFIRNSKRTMGKFVALTKGGECKDLKDKNGGVLTISNHGLFCNSHYGKLQFLHSMAKEDGVVATDTWKLIDEWVSFSYRLATENLEPSRNYCDFWESNQDYPNLSKIMYERIFREGKPNLCEKRHTLRTWILRKPQINEWTIGTTFNFVCKNPISSEDCYVYSSTINEEPKNIIKKSALGSIIHLIQDSFSRSHTDRGGDDDIYPQLICKNVKSFRSYSNQNDEKHGKSDKWPTLDVSCYDSKILDPITATAKIIWLAHNNNKTNKTINELMLIIFGSDLSGNKSSSGKQYQ